MARINNTQPGLQNVATIEELKRFTAMTLNAIIDQFNGKVDFGDNIRTSGPLDVAFVTPGVAVKVNHTLGRTPVGYLVSSQDAAGNILRPATPAWNATSIFLSASSAMNAELMLF